ncbi:MAG: glycoside hydrolase [Acidobacteriota bacterium]
MSYDNSSVFITFLWHMHQPMYKDPRNEEYILPWVRLHAIKDYFDMAALIESVPQMRAVINIVPSLFVQLEDYSKGSAKDTYLIYSSKPVSKLTVDEKLFLLKNFFTINKERKIDPSPRYSELWQKQSQVEGQPEKALSFFTLQDYLDLQVLFNLAWCGLTLKKDAEVAALIDKDRNFTQEEKRMLLAKQQKLITKILPLYRHLQEQGQIEISVSPFYHPLLPLICDNYLATKAHQELQLPEHRFSYPHDAEEQIRLAMEYYSKLFGTEPRGMWPPEGGVSNKVLELAINHGIRWLATDEAIMRKSLAEATGAGKQGRNHFAEEKLYAPYKFKNQVGEIWIFFRNQVLSNRISFVYSSWDEEEAANDFCHRLLALKNSLKKREGHYIISIIMDGENAWEYFPQGGERFLLSLYRKIVDSREFVTITCSEFLNLQDRDSQLYLTHIAPGSWIDGGFSTWIGEPSKNEAWDYLSKARRTLEGWISNLTPEEKQQKSKSIEKALNAIYIAEGSDWFWWLKRGEQPESEKLFSILFKLHLAEMYRALGMEVPLYLRVANQII